MVVSRDWQEISVLECILGGLHIDCEVESQPDRAQAKLAKTKVDALIVDCDLSGTERFLRNLQGNFLFPINTPLVVMSGPRTRRDIEATGALFSFEKPISVEQAVRTLSAARNMIVDGRLRYHRTGLEVPVSLRAKGQENKDAQLINLSQGGMQVRTEHWIDADSALKVHFELPGARSTLKANAEVVWHDKSGNFGMRFLNVPKPQQRTLQLWLAQQFLAN